MSEKRTQNKGNLKFFAHTCLIKEEEVQVEDILYKTQYFWLCPTSGPSNPPIPPPSPLRNFWKVQQSGDFPAILGGELPSAPPCPSPLPIMKEIYVLKWIWFMKTKIGKLTIRQPEFCILIVVVKTLCLYFCFKRERLRE